MDNSTLFNKERVIKFLVQCLLGKPNKAKVHISESIKLSNEKELLNFQIFNDAYCCSFVWDFWPLLSIQRNLMERGRLRKRIQKIDNEIYCVVEHYRSSSEKVKPVWFISVVDIKNYFLFARNRMFPFSYPIHTHFLRPPDLPLHLL